MHTKSEGASPELLQFDPEMGKWYKPGNKHVDGPEHQEHVLEYNIKWNVHITD